MHCQKCKSTENLYENSKRVNKNGELKISYMCRACNTARLKRYRQTPEGKKKAFDAVYRSVEKNMHKQLARIKMNYQLKKGNITKPDHCEMCNEIHKLEGHHDDYSKPLEVRWLCRPCHAEIHKKVYTNSNITYN